MPKNKSLLIVHAMNNGMQLHCSYKGCYACISFISQIAILSGHKLAFCSSVDCFIFWLSFGSDWIVVLQSIIVLWLLWSGLQNIFFHNEQITKNKHQNQVSPIYSYAFLYCYQQTIIQLRIFNILPFCFNIICNMTQGMVPLKFKIFFHILHLLKILLCIIWPKNVYK